MKYASPMTVSRFKKNMNEHFEELCSQQTTFKPAESRFLKFLFKNILVLESIYLITFSSGE